MKIIALYSMKGGVGKTAAAVNLAYCAALDGKSTLLVDIDPQASASYYFRVKPGKKHNVGSLVKGGKKLDKNIRETDFENLDLLPAHLSYRNLDLVLDDLKKARINLETGTSFSIPEFHKQPAKLKLKRLSLTLLVISVIMVLSYLWFNYPSHVVQKAITVLPFENLNKLQNFRRQPC